MPSTSEAKHLRISAYDYDLPEHRIARYPVAGRDTSKLLVYDGGNIRSHTFTDLPDLLPEGSLLVMNNTKVIQARLHFRKETGALIEIFCLEPHWPHDYQMAFDRRESCEWLCLVGNRKKWKQGKLSRIVEVGTQRVTLQAEQVGTQGESVVIRFTWNNSATSFAELLDAIGELPIPPYLNRDTEESDKETYQTVYSRIEGSVAAPTAGLHFTDRVLQALKRRNITCDEITLHVGAGTFRPVKAEEMAGHTMHAEYIYVSRTSIERLIEHGGHCTAVGTTTVRTLESLYYIGLKLLRQSDLAEDALHVAQWEPYEQPADTPLPSTKEALDAILHYLTAHQLSALHTSTQIIIAPGYEYHIVDRMVTNFHMPKSTLLLLVSAFIGDDWRNVYDYAMQHDYRFLSYGDSSLLIPARSKTAMSDANDARNALDDMVPLVDEDGNIVGAVTRRECHSGSKLLHPVVHLHVFNSRGELYLQKRPDWKDIQPGRWDTACGGHVDLGENVEQALRREVREELGIEDFMPKRICQYVFESKNERELVFVHTTVYDGPVARSTTELSDGRFWSAAEIKESIGKGIFTPNFEQEYQDIVLPARPL